MNVTTTSAPAALLQGGSLIALHIRIWSGAAVIYRDTDLATVASQLPPKTLVSDGDAKLVDPKVLNPLDALRKRADAAVRKVGFRFLNGHFVADSQIPALKAELDAIGVEFEQEAAKLEADLPNHYSAWEGKHAQWGSMLRRAQLPAPEVKKRCMYGVVFYKIATPAAEANSEINQGLLQAASNIHEDLYADVSKQADDVLTATFVGRLSLPGQRALRPVRSLAAKLKSFAFLDAGVAKLAAVLENALSSVPSTGHLDTLATGRIVAALQALSTPSALAATLAAPIVSVPVTARVPTTQSLPGMETTEEQSDTDSPTTPVDDTTPPDTAPHASEPETATDPVAEEFDEPFTVLI